MATAIEARSVTKRYGGSYGVKDISFSIEEGTVYGFIGPNGAGKTTTISLLTGLVPPTSGEVLIFGKPMRKERLELKKRIGVVPDSPHLYGYMTAAEYLEFFSEIYGLNNNRDRISDLLSYFNLSEHSSKKLKKYSHGMRQKVSIARALVHDPDVLFMDEPISGLDPAGVKEVRDVILGEKKKGKTVFISSHILSEIDKVCDEVGIINKGRLVMSGPMEKTIKAIGQGIEHVIEVDRINPSLIPSLQAVAGVSSVSAEGNILRVRADAGRDVRREISKVIAGSGALILAMSKEHFSLEDAFVRLIKEGENLSC